MKYKKLTVAHHMVSFILFLLILTGDGHASNNLANNTNRLEVGVTSPLNKVFQSKPFEFQGQYTNQAEIELALNEYEATQIVLFPKIDLTDITISVGPLTHENTTDTITTDSIKINPIGYVYLKGGKKTLGRTGYHPDILLPNQPLNLKKGIPLPVLVTVYASSESKPGRYHTTVTIKANDGPAQTIEIKVLVHSIQIPEQPKFKSLSLARRHGYAKLWPENQGFKKLDEQQEWAVFMRMAEIGFRNYLPPTGFLVNGLVSYNSRNNEKSETYVTYPTHDRKTGNFNTATTDEYINYMQSKGANSFFIGITSDIYKYEHNSKEREATLLKYLDDLIPHLKKRGVLAKSYLYNIDEPWGEAVDHGKDIYRLIKERYDKDITVMQNTNQNNYRILAKFLNHFDAIDINLGFYNITKIERFRAKHPELFQDVWWNLNLWPRSRPNLFLEYPLIDARIIGPMSFRFKIQGFEYWELVATSKISNYSPVKSHDFQLDWVVSKNSLDGLLLYPNYNHGFYSSMRFESFRDGMEDLELLYLLQALAPENTLLTTGIIKDIDDYSESINQYTAFRRSLLEEISRLQ